MSFGKTIRRIAIGLAILIVAVLIAGYFVLRSARFHRYVIAQVEQKLQQATGGRAEIASYSFDLRPLVITVNHLVVHGTEPPGALPLFQTDRIVLGLKLVSLLHGKVDLADIEVDHPVANLMVDRNSQTNIPHPQTKSSSSTNIWDLGIQHLLISNGEIYYSSKATPLNADLHDLLTRAQYDNQQQRFVGELSYRRGHLQFGSYTPIAHDLDSHFTVSPTNATFEPLVLRVASSELTVRAAVQNYSQPSMNGSYRIVLHTEDVRRVLKNPSLPLGVITVSGSLVYQNIPGRSALETVVSKGELNCPQLLLETPTLRGTVYHVSGAYDIANGNLSAHNLHADLLGGQLNANLNVHDVAVKRVSSLRASLKGISIQDAARVMRSMQSPPPLTGHADADMQANWHGSMQGLRALLNASLNAAITPPRSRATTPLTGILHATYTSQGETLSLNQAQLQTPSTLIQMSGPVGDHSNLQLRASSSNLHELETLALALKPPAAAPNGAQPSPPPSIFGSASLNANVQGSLQQPRVTGRLNSQSLQIEDTHWRTLEAVFAASPSEISVQRGSLVSAGEGSIQFDADVGLRDWHYLPADPLSAHFYVNRMPADQLTHLAKLSYPITGTLSAQVSIHGSQLAPLGNGSVRLTQARVAGTSIPRAAIDFSATGNEVHSTANATLAGGGVNATLTYYPGNQGYVTHVDVQQIHLEQIEKAQTLHISGLLSASASGRGTLHDPQLSATASIPQLQVNQKTISGINAQLDVANQSANFQVNSNIAQSFVQARGTVALTGDKYATLRLDSKGIALHTLLAAYLPAQAENLQGELELHATASGPLSKPTQMQAQLQIPVFTASYGQVQIGAAHPIVAQYRNGIITLQPTEIKGTGTDINLEGMVPVQGSRPASFTATGGIDLALLHLLNPDLTSAGKIELDIHGTGNAAAPGIHGQVRLVNAGFTSLSTPIGVENVNGVLAINNNEIQIQNFVGQMGGGQFTASGTVAYRPQTQFNVSLKANHVRLLYPEGLRTILQSDLLLAGNTQSAELSGRVLLDSMSFSQGFDLASFMSQTSSASSGAEPEQGFAQNLHLNIALQSANDLGLTSSQVSLQGSVNLRVSGAAADPVILGRADITRGELFFMGKRYQIQRGIAQFNNPARTEPVLNFLVTTKVNQYDISLALMGPLDRLRTHYVSDPPLPPVDIINLLARGQTTEEAAAAPANMGANQVIASGLAGQVSGQIQKLAGISSLQIDPLIGGNNRNPGARLSIQQRVTKNFFFTYSIDVTSTQDQIVQGEYQFTKHWSGSLVRDQFGNIGVDAKYRKTF